MPVAVIVIGAVVAFVVVNAATLVLLASTRERREAIVRRPRTVHRSSMPMR
ncbi:MAG TPA: hypothetical protein VIB48_00995 [Acidimicrobiia bacterium]|jgi:hypothetical protein